MQVRLAYQGIELKMAEDDHKFVKRQAADVMHAMKKSEEPQQQGVVPAVTHFCSACQLVGLAYLCQSHICDLHTVSDFVRHCSTLHVEGELCSSVTTSPGCFNCRPTEHWQCCSCNAAIRPERQQLPTCLSQSVVPCATAVQHTLML